MKKWVNKTTLIVIGAIFTINISFLFVAVWAGWPDWWVNINYELSPLTWFSSVQLILVGISCLSISALSGIQNARGADPIDGGRLWGVLGIGFFFLAIDERFQIHERIREGIFKPHNIGTSLPGIGAGDFLLILYAAVGLIIAYKLFKSIKECAGARRWFIAAILLSAIAVCLDAPDMHRENLMFFRKMQFIEEIIETAAQASFLSSFILYFRKILVEAMDVKA